MTQVLTARQSYIIHYILSHDPVHIHNINSPNLPIADLEIVRSKTFLSCILVPMGIYQPLPHLIALKEPCPALPHCTFNNRA